MLNYRHLYPFHLLSIVEECQKLWKTLRDRFIRETRVLENNEKLTGSSETAAAAAVRWPYYEALMFYRNCGRSPRLYHIDITVKKNVRIFWALSSATNLDKCINIFSMVEAHSSSLIINIDTNCIGQVLIPFGLFIEDCESLTTMIGPVICIATAESMD